MFQQVNEFRYNAQSGKSYIVYFLKFWKEADDYILKYEIRATDRDFFWYGRMSKERALFDLKISDEEAKKMPAGNLEQKILEYFRTLFISVMKVGLDKGYEEPNTEFVFYKEQLVVKRKWQGL